MTTLDLLSTPKAAALSLANRSGAVSRETADAGLIFLPLRKIADNPYQPRATYDPEHILNLAASIRSMKEECPATLGLQQVPMARVGLLQGDGTIDAIARHFYTSGQARQILQREEWVAQLMFGHSRQRAFMLLADGLAAVLKHDHIGVNVRSVAEVETRFAALLAPDPDYTQMPVTLGFALDHAMWMHAITENSQRKNINPIEEAQSIQRAMDEFGLSPEEAGKPFGYARSTTANKVRLLALPNDVQKMIVAGELSERHGRELLRVAADPERVQRLAAMATKKQMPVRQLAENVNWEEKALNDAQEKARQLAAARVAVAAGWSPLDGMAPIRPAVVELDDWKLSKFDAKDAGHIALLHHGKCSADVCACMVVAYSQHRSANGFRPDPVNAPHCCLACTDANARQAKKLALGDLGASDGERERAAVAAEKRRQADAINNAAHAHWQRWLKEQDKHALWNNIGFWRAVFGVSAWGVEKIAKQAPDVQTACDELLKLLYQSTRDYDRELNYPIHTVEAAQKLIDQLSGAVSRKTEEYANIEQVWEAIAGEDDWGEREDGDEQDED